MTFNVIKRGILVPPSRTGQVKDENSRNGRLRKLKVGECIDFECTPKLAANTATYVGKETKRRFTVRAIKGGSRVWRTE